MVCYSVSNRKHQLSRAEEVFVGFWRNLMVVGAVICGLLFLPDDPDRVWRVAFSSLAGHVHKHTAPKSINQSIKENYHR